MTRQPFRIQPLGPVHGYRTFGQRVTRRVQATCAEVGCGAYAKGWVTTVLPASEDMATLLAACRGEIDGHRRTYTMLALPDGFVRYTFEPGQPCFKASTHRMPMAVVNYHRVGDWRNAGHPGDVVTHPDTQSWVDEFGAHQQKIAEQRQRYGAE